MQDETDSLPALIHEARQLVAELRGLRDAERGGDRGQGELSLVQKTIQRLAVAGVKSSLFQLPADQLEAVCEAMVQPGANGAAIHRRLCDETKRDWHRNAFYRFMANFRSAYAEAAGVKPAQMPPGLVAPDRSRLAGAIESLRRQGRKNRLLAAPVETLIEILGPALARSKHTHSRQIRMALEAALGERLNSNAVPSLINAIRGELAEQNRRAAEQNREAESPCSGGVSLGAPTPQ